MITQERLKEVLNYNKDTGVFTWISAKGSRAKINDIAGCKTWHGYLTIQVDGKLYMAHVLAWLYEYGYLPELQIDHKNQIKTDNWIDNLREVTAQINNKNRPKQKNNTSGVNGVYWHKNHKKWVAKIKLSYKTIHIGYFDTLYAAAYARHYANIKYGFHENHGKPKSI